MGPLRIELERIEVTGLCLKDRARAFGIYVAQFG